MTRPRHYKPRAKPSQKLLRASYESQRPIDPTPPEPKGVNGGSERRSGLRDRRMTLKLRFPERRHFYDHSRRKGDKSK